MIAAALYSGSMCTGERGVLLLRVYLPYKFSLNMKCYSLVTATVMLVCVAQWLSGAQNKFLLDEANAKGVFQGCP